MTHQFKVGDKVWRFDLSRRVYDGKGRFGGSAIYSEHFYEDTIIGETSRSWIVGMYNDKFSKKDPQGLYTDKQKADDIWLHNNQYKLSDAVRYCNDVDKLRQIAQIVGYVEEPR